MPRSAFPSPRTQRRACPEDPLLHQRKRRWRSDLRRWQHTSQPRRSYASLEPPLSLSPEWRLGERTTQRAAVQQAERTGLFPLAANGVLGAFRGGAALVTRIGGCKPRLVLGFGRDRHARGLTQASQPVRQQELGIARIETEQQLLSHLLVREDIRLPRTGLQRSRKLRLECQQGEIALDQQVVQLIRLSPRQRQLPLAKNHHYRWPCEVDGVPPPGPEQAQESRASVTLSSAWSG